MRSHKTKAVFEKDIISFMLLLAIYLSNKRIQHKYNIVYKLFVKKTHL